MTLHVFSRRRLLGGLLASLAACLYPRSPGTAAPCRSDRAASRRPHSPVFYNTYIFDYNTDVPGGQGGFVTTYVYNYDGRPPCVRGQK